MKKLFLILAIAFGFLLATKAANAGNCGFRPYPPYGCSAANATCVCGGRLGNQCEWVFIGC